MTVRDYEAVRSNPNTFLVLPGHDVQELEDVVREGANYVVVSKVGAGIDRLRVENDLLRTENEQLRMALASRIVIEQAKGVLVERIDLPPEDVFRLLRMAARRARRNIHEVAEEILKTRTTPDYIEREIGHLRKRR